MGYPEINLQPPTIAPARCCLKNIGQVGANDDIKPKKAAQVDLSVEELLVEKAFKYLNEISEMLVKELNLHPGQTN